MRFAMTYLTAGLLFIIFSHEFAEGSNQLTFRFYEFFPALKKLLPASRLAGTVKNYKSLYYFSRILGISMTLVGFIFMGMIMLYRA